MAAFTVIGGIFIGGFAMQDPGGTTGTLMTLAWVVPMLILAVSAWFWPARNRSPAARPRFCLHCRVRVARLRPRCPEHLPQ